LAGLILVRFRIGRIVEHTVRQNAVQKSVPLNLQECP